MTFTRKDVGLFFSLPLDAQDLANLGASKVQRVMFPFYMANAPLLSHMADTQKRVTLRLNESDYYTDTAAGVIKTQLLDKRRYANVDTVIVGVEPENAVNFSYDHDWQEQAAWRHANYAGRVITALKDTGVRVVTPGWTCRSISEDELPQPGATTWREICRPTYEQATLAGCHIYGYSWRSPVDTMRAKWALKRAQEQAHFGNIVIDEFAVYSAESEHERMAALIDFAAMLEKHPLGQRVDSVFHFIANGDGVGWPIKFVVREPACYEALGQFMEAAPK